jgi:hypothetical protein
MSENTTPQGSGTLTVDTAASAFLGMMDAAEAAENGQAETEETGQEYEAADEPELVDSEQADDQPTRKYRIKAAGEEREVTEQELIEGYQLGADYTKKTQKLSDERKSVEAERAKIQEASKLRDQYAQRLQMMEQFLSQQNKGENLEALKELDPIGYAVKVAEMSQREKQLAVLQQEQQRIAQQQQAEQSERLQYHLAEESQKLSSVIPGYANPKEGDSIRKDIREYAKSIGWSDQELAGLYDSRAVLSLYHGMKYAKLQSNKPSVNKKLEAAPKMLKAGTSMPRNSEAEQNQKLRAKLQQTGKIRDAALLFEKYI